MSLSWGLRGAPVPSALAVRPSFPSRALSSGASPGSFLRGLGGRVKKGLEPFPARTQLGLGSNFPGPSRITLGCRPLHSVAKCPHGRSGYARPGSPPPTTLWVAGQPRSSRLAKHSPKRHDKLSGAMVIGWPIPPLPLLCGGFPREPGPGDLAGCLPGGGRAFSRQPGAPHGLMPADTCSSSAGAAGWGRGGIVGGVIMKSSAGLRPSIVQVANK